MNKSLGFAAFVSILILMMFLVQFASCQSLDIPPPSATSGGGGGGGSRQIDMDRIYKALQDGKQQKPQKFEELKKLLYIEPFTTREYNNNLGLNLSFKGNKTLNRTQQFVIGAYVANYNPIEIRRAVFLRLEELDPGEKAFRQVNSVPQIIQVNEYTQTKDGSNITYRTFPDLTSFAGLKKVGAVVLRLKATDGQYTWTSKNLTLNLINNPPVLSNLSVEAPNPARYNDPIKYVAEVNDVDGDAVNITLHVIDSRGREKANVSQVVLPGSEADFLANQYGFFGKADSGKNFTYYYSFGDGINITNTTMQDGPRLRKSTAIWVDNAKVVPEDEFQYWWQSYNFSADMKNQEQGNVKVLVTLFTDTPAHPWKAVATQEVTLTPEPRPVFFTVKPFDVQDVNQTFKFKFTYSEYDQHQKDFIEAAGARNIGAKLIKYEIASPVGLANIFIILLASLLAGMLIERRFYR
jgi:hypothetical protein